MSKKIKAFGEEKSIGEWSRDPRCRVSYATLRRRIRDDGWLPEQAIVATPTSSQGIHSAPVHRGRVAKIYLSEPLHHVLQDLAQGRESLPMVCRRLIFEALRRRGLWEGLTPDEFNGVTGYLFREDLEVPEDSPEGHRQALEMAANRLTHEELGLLLDPFSQDPRSLSRERMDRLGCETKRQPNEHRTSEAEPWLTTDSVLELLEEYSDDWWSAAEVADTIEDERPRKLRLDSARITLRRLHQRGLLDREKDDDGRKWVYRAKIQ